MARETIAFGLFAYELVQHVSDYKNWSSAMLHRYKGFARDSYFDRNIGDAVHFIIEQNNHHISDCYGELDSICEDPKRDITYFALDAVPMHFPAGYTPENFLSFCAMLLGVVKMFVESYELETVLDAAAEVIQSLLTYFALISDFSASEDIPELIKVSKHICRKLRCKAKK